MILYFAKTNFETLV